MIMIVSGLPRSGTSLMMRMLEVGGMPVLADGIRAADIDNPNGYYEFEPIKQTDRDSSWLDQAEGHAVKMVYKLLETLPLDRDYKVLFMRRALKEVVASQNRMLKRLSTAGSISLVATDRSVPAGGATAAHLFNAHRLVGMFSAEIVRTRAWLMTQPRFQLLEVSYNRLLTQPKAEISEIICFCGGGLDAAAMREVIDPRLYRQRSP